MARRRARRQQHVRLANTILHGSGNQLQRLDAGQYAHLGLSDSAKGNVTNSRQAAEKDATRGALIRREQVI